MPIPQILVPKLDGKTGVIRPGADGICAILAPAPSGTLNQPTSIAKKGLAAATFGQGILAELCEQVMAISGKGVIAVRTAASTVGAYSAFTNTAGGTSTPAAGASEPVDDFDVVIDWVTGGILGTAGIEYRVSLDGGKTFSKKFALGTALNFIVAGTGVQVTVGTSTQTMTAGRKTTFTTTGPQSTTADLVDAYEALRVTTLDWECVYAWGDAAATHVSQMDTYLTNLETNGRFRWGVLNARRKGAAESEATYATAMAAIRTAASSIRLSFGADGGDMVSITRGIRQFRPTALGFLARTMKIDLAVEPAYVADGPLQGVSITDDRGNPKYHNEAATPALDDLAMLTLRTLDKRPGAYLTNGLVFSPDGSDYVLTPQLRVINRACTVVFDTLTNGLSQGITTNPKEGAGGEKYISEDSALAIEGMVRANLNRELNGRVSDFAFSINRTDDIGSNGGALLTGSLQIESIKYVKRFTIQASFARDISAST